MEARAKKLIAVAVANVIAVSGFCAADASADTFLFEDFEAQPITPPGQKMEPPAIGYRTYYNPATSVEAANVVTGPLVKDTKSLEVFRTSISADVGMISTENALVNGKTLELRWSHGLAGGTGHRFNAPMQNSIGYTNGGVGQLAFITINDNFSNPSHAGEYHYSDAFTGQNFTGLLPSINGIDNLRMVMTLQEYDATYMTGTYDLFISLNGAPEVQVANDANLNYAEKANPADPNIVGPTTALFFRMQKGPFTSNSYYDNISVTDVGPAWNVDGNGVWSAATNWSPTAPANAAGGSARFGTVITAPRTVTLDAPQTIGHLVFDNANRYTVSGASTLQVSAPTNATLTVLAGNHTIAAPVSIASATTAAIGGGTTLTLSGPSITTDPGVTLTKVGAGRLELTHFRGAGLSVEAGTVAILPNGGNAGTSKVETLAIDTTNTARLDLSNNKLITATAAGTASGGVYSGVQRDVQTAYAGGAWTGNGLTTSQPQAAEGLTTIAVATGAQLGVSTFGGQSVAPTDTIAFYTYGGDTNFDGMVSGDDYGTIDFSILVPGSDGYYNGDFNYDGVINGDDYGIIDFTIIAQGAPFPTSGAAGGLTAVPEPATCALAIIAAASSVGWRRRRR